MGKSTKKKPFIIAIPIFNGVDLMDIAAPREIFSWLSTDKSFNRKVRVYYVGAKGKENKYFTTNNHVRIKRERTFHHEEVMNPDLIWVPGGMPDALEGLLKGTNPNASAFFEYIINAGFSAEYVCSVCEGAILLANTGLLNGYNITTHWAFVNCFEHYPEVTLVEGNPRYVQDRNRVTGGGISSGLDEAFYLVMKIAGQESAIAVQQTMQYYPCPPVSSEIPTAPAVCPVKGMN